ncbi:ubiquitin carboxyl-terminal hydrolase [Ecytonucleospora hepatopenaei]|uniref:Ubiquitin carboxyl-terminal hydrolase n=1 Tax=Ecytonucleospora hepatopenaei TaxID=646526 RepID=A0A1W0E339_9MICR|nr:ubiquitin carboxyl-terminal hydrolase [Ecytonucleospora hepatopenaei]
MKKFQESIFTHIFTKNGESSSEFSSFDRNGDSSVYSFKLHYKNKKACIAFNSKVYRDTKFKINMNVKYGDFSHEMEFSFDFSLFNNTFIIDLVKLSERQKNKQEFNVFQENPLEIKIFIEKSTVENAFSGLTNLGATCYINSLLQTMRYMGGFQQRLFDGENKFYSLNLKRLFYAMSTTTECNKTDINNNYTGSVYEMVRQFIMNLPFVESVHEHQDVHEFSKILFDKLEIENKKLIEETIEGKMDVIFRLDCGCTLRRKETYQDIQLELNSSENMEESFSKFILPENIDEFNCEKHGKTKATKNMYIGKETPDYLFILIKRFAFDWETGESIKHNGKFRFSDEFDLSNYMEKDNRDKGCEYELFSNIVHMGSISQGHFYCYIKIKGKFYKFNDEEVTEALDEEVMDWNFGGKNEFTGREKCFSSYYLVYKKKDVKNEVFYLENVPSILTEKPAFREVGCIEQETVEGYHGPGCYDNDNDYKRMALKTVTLSQFDNIQCVFKNAKVFQQSKEGKFEEINQINGNGPLIHKNKYNKGKLLFLKMFEDKIECMVYPEKLTLVNITVAENYQELKQKGDDDFCVFREKRKGEIENEQMVEEINQDNFSSLQDGDVIILASVKKEVLNLYLKYLHGHRRIFVQYGDIKVPLIVPKKLSIKELTNKIEEDFVCSGVVLLEGRTRKCKDHECFDAECVECYVQSKNIVKISFVKNMQVLFVGVMFGRLNAGAIEHVHPFFVEIGCTRADLIKKCLKSKHLCMGNIGSKKEFDVVGLVRDSTNVVYYKKESDVILEGGMVVLLDKIEHPLVVCKLNEIKEINGYPIILEKVETIGDLKRKYMILAKIYKFDKNAPEKYIEMSDQEIIGLDEKEVLFIE